MANFVWTAKNKAGEPVVREVMAGTSKEAEAILLAEGCSDLKLMEDEIGAATTAGMGKSFKFLGEEITVTAEQKLKHMEKPRATFFRVLLDGVKQSKWFVLMIAAIAALELYSGHKVAVLWLGVGLLAWLVFLVCVGLPSIYYAKLVKASDWHRWTEVEETVETLERLGTVHFIKLPPAELGRHQAKALAGTGRLAEALRDYQRFENQPGCPSWLYKCFVGSLYGTAKQYDKAIEYNLKAIEEKPSAALYLDLANRYARYKRDPVKARAAVAEADKGVIPELAKSFRLRCLAIIAYLENDNVAALREFETFLQVMAKHPNRPYRDGHISVAKGYLCCVLAKMGDRVAARKAYLEAKEYLVATGETELMAECEGLMGG